VPELFVAPRRLFDDVSDQHVEFDSTKAIRTAAATQLGFRMVE
jgi:hypothetical protein